MILDSSILVWSGEPSTCVRYKTISRDVLKYHHFGSKSDYTKKIKIGINLFKDIGLYNNIANGLCLFQNIKISIAYKTDYVLLNHQGMKPISKTNLRKTSSAVILAEISLVSILPMRSRAGLDMDSHIPEWKSSLEFFIASKTDSNESPWKGRVPTKRAWRSTPALQISTFSEYFPVNTSGAT